VLAVSNGTGIGGGFAEAAAIPHPFHYGPKVIVFSVAIEPPEYFQIS
jgi:hypothetical protein